MKTPAIVLNFKTYKEATGKAAITLAKVCDEVARDKGVEIVVCPQLADAAKIAETVDIPVLAQHFDPITPGSHTGWVLLDSLVDAGLAGSLINHSEHRIPKEDVEKCVKMLKDVGLESIVCTKDIGETAAYSHFTPNFLAIEPPELIGSGISVSEAQPEIVSGAAKAGGDVPVFCGAGITKGVDVKKAIELGACGVLLASGVTKSKEPGKVLSELASYVLSV